MPGRWSARSVTGWLERRLGPAPGPPRRYFSQGWARQLAGQRPASALPAGDIGLRSPLEVVEELAGRFAAGDRDGAMQLFHADIRIQQPASLPHGGWHHGHRGMAEMGAAFSRHWERAIENPRILGCGATVVQITTQTWRARATGRSATVDVVELFAVTGGLISEIRVFQQDTQLLLATLDAR